MFTDYLYLLRYIEIKSVDQISFINQNVLSEKIKELPVTIQKQDNYFQKWQC